MKPLPLVGGNLGGSELGSGKPSRGPVPPPHLPPSSRRSPHRPPAGTSWSLPSSREVWGGVSPSSRLAPPSVIKLALQAHVLDEVVSVKREYVAQALKTQVPPQQAVPCFQVTVTQEVADRGLQGHHLPAPHPLCIPQKAPTVFLPVAPTEHSTKGHHVTVGTQGGAAVGGRVWGWGWGAADAPPGLGARRLQGDPAAGLLVFHSSPVQAPPSSSSCNPLLSKPRALA